MTVRTSENELKILKVIEILDTLMIKYERFDHPAVYTVAEAKAVCDFKEHGCKNLFLKDRKTKKYFLVILPDDKKANIKSIETFLGQKNMTFANESEMLEYLNLTPGAVSPFGLINDKNKIVTAVIDEDISNSGSVSFHPNVNTCSVLLSYEDFMKFIDSTGNTVVKVNF